MCKGNETKVSSIQKDDNEEEEEQELSDCYYLEEGSTRIRRIYLCGNLLRRLLSLEEEDENMLKECEFDEKSDTR